MRLIDADALMDDIKRDTKKAIEQEDIVGSFWLGYAAGLVIKQPTIQPELDSETLIRTIETGITATNSNDAYSLGMRNGMRWCKSLIDGAEPKFEDVTDSAELLSTQPEQPWIPVGERLPEEYGEYLVTKRTIGWNCEEYDVNDIAYFDDDGFHKADRIIAWMPLPTPYTK